MSLTAELNGVLQGFVAQAPKEIVEPVTGSVTELKSTHDPKSTIQVGDTIPSFNLTNASGKAVSSADLLSKGPILINFYRGSWCPFCSLELRALQKHLDQFRAKGVTLVAISPELPDTSLSTVEKNELKFEVLSDAGQRFARQLGIVWKMPDYLRPVWAKFGHDLVTRNGDDSFEVPIPATLLVDGKGVVRNAYIDPDYTKRVEPDTILEWIDAL